MWKITVLFGQASPSLHSLLDKIKNRAFKNIFETSPKRFVIFRVVSLLSWTLFIELRTKCSSCSLTSWQNPPRASASYDFNLCPVQACINSFKILFNRVTEMCNNLHRSVLCNVYNLHICKSPSHNYILSGPV